MSAKISLDVKGLVLAPGELSRASGSLIQADNVNVEAPGIIRSRQGVAKSANGVGGPIWKLATTKELGSNLLVNYGTNTEAASLAYGDGSAAWTIISGAGTFSNAAATRMQTAVSRRNHYITTDEGVRRIETDILTTHYAGMPKGLGIDLRGPTAVLVRSVNYSGASGNFTVGETITGGTSAATAVIRADLDGGSAGTLSCSAVSASFTPGETITGGTSLVTAITVGAAPVAGFLSDASSVSYRVTWSKKDAQGVPMEGAPGDLRVVKNNTRTSGWVTAVAQNVLCRIPLPTQVGGSTALTTSYFWRLWRSADVGSGITPGDNMSLVGEAFLTSGNITAGYVEFVDTAPEAYRKLSPALYTNPTLGGDSGVGGPGIDQSNNPPPAAHDVALFAECLFYSDLIFPYTLDFTLLSVVSGVGLTAADTLTIGGIVYTAHGSVTSNNQFVVITSTGPTDTTNSEAIERTAQNLCTAINNSTTNTTTRAYYVSGPDSLPGMIRLEARAMTSGSFTAVASAHGNAFRPNISTAVTSVRDVYANGYAFSKPNQGDAVPGVNLGFIGRDDTALLRMVVLRDALFMFTDAGVYRLTGRNFDEFAVQEFDLTFRLIGREMLCVCDDYIYAWGYEGIARISSAGVEYISNAIEPLLQKAVKDLGGGTAAYTHLGSYAWATAYRSRHKVLFAFPTVASGGNQGNCPKTLVYDTRMEAWTTWSQTVGVDVDKTTGYSSGVVRVSDDLLFYGQWFNGAGTLYVFKERLAYAAADFKDDTYDASNVAITKTVEWSALASSPELETHWDELHLLFDVSSTFTAWTTPTSLVSAFTADLGSSSGNVTHSPTATAKMSRCSIPQAQRRSARMIVYVSHAVASEYFGLEGMVLVHLPGEGTATTRT